MAEDGGIDVSIKEKGEYTELQHLYKCFSLI